MVELWFVLNAFFLVTALRAAYYPFTTRSVPSIRFAFRRVDRALARYGILGGVTGAIVFAEMFMGLAATEAGVHVALLNWIVYSLVKSQLDFGNHTLALPLAFRVTQVCCLVMVINYFVGALLSWWEMRAAFQRARIKEKRHPILQGSLFIKTVLMELLFLATSVVGISFRHRFPNVSVKRGILYDEELKLKLDVFYPTSYKRNEKLPVLFYLHGGSWIGGYRHHVPALLPTFVAQGGVAVSASYRLAPSHPFPAHVQDANKAVRWIVDNIESFGGDPSFIVGCGGSAGAHLTSLAAVSTLDLHMAPKNQNPIAAVVSYYGVFDWGLEGTEEDLKFRKFLSRVIVRKTEEEYPEQFKHGSPAWWIQERSQELMNFPFLLLHGKNDNVVPFESIEKFFKQVKSLDMNVVAVDLSLAHHAFDIFHSLRAVVVNMYVCEWIFFQFYSRKK